MVSSQLPYVAPLPIPTYSHQIPNVIVGGEGVLGGRLCLLMCHQVWTAGQVIGLIHDIPTCADLVERISNDAEDTLKERLALVSPTQSKL